MPTTTLAELALRLGRTQRQVRNALRELYGTSPDEVTQWELSEEQVDAVLARLGRSAAPVWSLEIGDVVTRRQIHAAYGGQEQSGIVTPKSTGEILIFSDLVKGARHGYDKFEGLREDGSYSYTGQGQVGDQEFKLGNLAVRDSAARGRVIRLFTTKGTLATYVGSFTTGDPPYTIRRIPGPEGERSGIIFNLVPIDADVALLPAFGGEAPLFRVGVWSPPDFSDVIVPQRADAFVGDRVMSRVEFELQRALGEWLTGQGHAPSTLELPVGNANIMPDLYVPERQWIVEAKKSTGREYVRGAIGQVLDYVHVARKQGIESKPVILLPGRPEPDLVDLIASLGIVLVVRREGEFDVIEPRA